MVIIVLDRRVQIWILQSQIVVYKYGYYSRRSACTNMVITVVDRRVQIWLLHSQIVVYKYGYNSRRSACTNKRKRLKLSQHFDKHFQNVSVVILTLLKDCWFCRHLVVYQSVMCTTRQSDVHYLRLNEDNSTQPNISSFYAIGIVDISVGQYKIRHSCQSPIPSCTKQLILRLAMIGQYRQCCRIHTLGHIHYERCLVRLERGLSS